MDDGTQYSPVAGYIFTFNLIVGAGALALPLAFYNAGLVRLLPPLSPALILFAILFGR